MTVEPYYYNCSPEYIHSIDPGIHDEILDSVGRLPKRQIQSEINADLFWQLTSVGWFYDTVPTAAGTNAPSQFNLEQVKERNQRDHCLTSTTLDTLWRADFAKSFDGKLVQIEAQLARLRQCSRIFADSG